MAMDFILDSFKKYNWKNYARPAGNLIPAGATERRELSRMRRDNEYSEELLRNKETELDLEEARFRR